MGASVGALVGSMLVPGFGLVGSGAGGISLGGASAPPSACSVRSPGGLPSDLLVLAVPCPLKATSGSGQSWLSSVSPPVMPWVCSGSDSVKVAVAMSLGCCELPPQCVCLVFTILEINLEILFNTC